MAWQPGDPVPYDGYYNGNVQLMMINGTYADFRPKFEEEAEWGILVVPHDVKKSQELLKKWDTQWEAIPLEQRMKARKIVIQDSTPVQVEVVTSKGKTRIWKAKPSTNNSAQEMSKQKSRGRKRKDRGELLAKKKGLLSEDDNPLLAEKPKSPLSSKPE